MTYLFMIYSAVVATAVAALLGAFVFLEVASRRRRGWEAAIRDKYLNILVAALMCQDDDVPRFPVLNRVGAKLILAEVVAGLVATTYGLDPDPLRRVVAAYRLEEFLLRRIRRSLGYRRAYYLSLLSRMPLCEATAARVEPYSRSRNRYVRFYAMMTRLAADPAMSLHLMAGYSYPLSAFEVSEIMTMLRRGALPVAYEPLIASPSYNLRTVGLGIVRQFGIEQAEPQLLRVVADACPELGREALYTLCSLRCSIERPEVARRIALMTLAERKALLRYMALEGYASEGLRKLFDAHERPYYESLVYSYKRSLV